jgi:flagellar basal body rod protein FlgC
LPELGKVMTTIVPAMSGMIAATARLNLSAQNTANAQTPGYQPQTAVQTATPSGVAVAKRPQSPGYFFAHEPNEPSADAEGNVAMPEVDEGQQAVERMQALTQFKANLQSLLSGDEMFKTALKVV